MFIRFDRMHERDGHTDTHRQTDKQTPHDDIGRACIASCTKMQATVGDYLTLYSPEAIIVPY